MAAALTLCVAASGCVQTAPDGRGAVAAAPVAPLRVTNNGTPFAMYDGAAARRTAEGICTGQGKRLRPSIYDRFESGAWVYVEGCA
jgi:hypothetical protein